MLKYNNFFTTTILLIFYLFIQILPFTNGLLANEYCRFDEDLKDRIRNLECKGDIDDCAGEVRQLVQSVYSGSFGVVILANKKDIKHEKVEWYINPIDPKPNRCRMIIDDNIVIEIFRTGYREMEIFNDQRHWIWRKAKLPDFDSDNELDLCPHSSLRQIITMFSIKAHSQMAEVR
uniref:Uncharacterized protein n=1 Tax=Panagrolaimus davidi TaxID=227884 RepID=A0A914QFI3_9BILA